MFTRMFYSSCLAGVVAGLVLTLLQAFWVAPLIFQAESYEGASGGAVAHSHGQMSHAHAGGAAVHSHEGYALVHGAEVVAAAGDGDAERGHGEAAHAHGEGGWGPEDGAERWLWTAVANMGTAIGFALLLSAVFAWLGVASPRHGLLWGAVGYVAFFASPALGLHPEVPGTFTAELLDRQLWWLMTAACTAGGLGALLAARGEVAKLIGIVLLVVPHAIGAPHPEAQGGLAPQALADQFAVATTAVNAVFWLLLGLVTATIYGRLAR